MKGIVGGPPNLEKQKVLKGEMGRAFYGGFLSPFSSTLGHLLFLAICMEFASSHGAARGWGSERDMQVDVKCLMVKGRRDG